MRRNGQWAALEPGWKAIRTLIRWSKLCVWEWLLTLAQKRQARLERRYVLPRRDERPDQGLMGVSFACGH